MKMELFRRPGGATTAGTQIGDDIFVDFKSDVPDTTGSARATAPISWPSDNPGAGDFEYSLKLTAVSSGTSTLTVVPTKLIIQIQIFKA
jgi:hypothetical protein